MKNNDRIYLMGGAKGVGKSTIIQNAIKNIYLPVVNTGNFFNLAEKTSPENYKSIAKQNMLSYLINNAPLIADTHYAGFINNIYEPKFERGLSELELHVLNKNVDLTCILIDMEPEILAERRKLDLVNERDQNLVSMCKELDANRKYFISYCDQLAIEGTVIKNNELDESIKEFIKIISI